MKGAAVPIIAALGLELALGLAVFQAYPKRRPNQCFLVLSFAIAAWLGSFLIAFTADTVMLADWAIRAASVTGVSYLAAVNLLRLAVRHSESSWLGLVRRSGWWILGTAAIGGLAATKFFLRGARLEAATAGDIVAVPVYGPGIYVYAAYFAAAILVLIVVSSRDLRKTKGREHAEIAFILVGAIVTLTLTLTVYQVLRLFIAPQRLLWLAPYRVVLFSLIVAYGIATRKILEVGSFLRHLMSYVVLAAYLTTLYLGVWWVATSALTALAADEARSIASLIAAVVVAFAMAPAKGVSQRLADRLLPGTRRLDFRATMRKATAILQSVSTLDNLLERFAKTIGEAVSTDRIIILLPSRSGYMQRYPLSQPGARDGSLEFRHDESLIQYLEENPEPLVLDELRRIRPTAEIDRITRQMQHLEIAVVMGIFSREHLAGIMLLGSRVSGRIYGSVEQNALQVLCGQLAVAIDNAQLFTEVQNAKIYNETLLHNMTTGVIAASAEGLITVFNHEAEEITQQRADELLDRSITNLPRPVRDLVHETLRTGNRQEDRELGLQSEEGTVVARASSSVFHDPSGQVLGALVVLTDITHLKRLEMQVRRSDRLASLGTLSAGMAHEIKNPLVSIKTFAQLLPERYQDSDFRETFSNLIGHEIDRIDSLVNQLLRFARPAKPVLKPLHIHEVLEKSLMLVGHRLYQKQIKLSRSWNADVDTIRADADQMEQVFLNFFLNAMDAMKQGGELNVSTEIRAASEWASPIESMTGHPQDEILRVSVRDNGEGIKNEDIAHVFDPFFTTKDYGTGLGLSVVHGIIQEHGGQIEVESELAKGTAFHILLPLVRFEEEVAAA
ncbi:MAG: ATP-binding protein [Chthoniobacterales bacterium]